MPIIKVITCDDHPLISTALKNALERDPEFHIVAQTDSGSKLMQILRKEPCHLLVLDFSMPGEMDGLALLSYVSRVYPDTRVAILTGTISSGMASQCLKNGALGLLRKSLDMDLIGTALKKVAQGRQYIDPGFQIEIRTADAAEAGLLKLSPRELTVIRLLVAGKSVTEIANQLNRSIKTISTQKQTAFEKLGIESEAELFRMAAERGTDLL
ncbi:response regulator [Paludibacterium paludis]|uniref:DNA-binding response regulator n=1 Tax=Paludibacterium paludis TaxID=1225769 RepID=A0A918P561_9NEIS|nr:response regulator transcription factor [Paludibacterium paludis]GGY20852.1 DNA-binding response regulator [Paludibacterium paludis]